MMAHEAGTALLDEKTRAGTARPGGTSDADAGTRGQLRVADRVVEKIAAIAAVEAGGVGPPPSRWLPGGRARTARADTSERRVDHRAKGSDEGSPRRGGPRVEASVHAGSASVALTMSVDYPGSVRQTAFRVRDEVRRRVEALTGLRVTHIDVVVPALRPGRSSLRALAGRRGDRSSSGPAPARPVSPAGAGTAGGSEDSGGSGGSGEEVT